MISGGLLYSYMEWVSMPDDIPMLQTFSQLLGSRFYEWTSGVMALPKEKEGILLPMTT